MRYTNRRIILLYRTSYLEVVREFELQEAEPFAATGGVVWRRSADDVGVNAVKDGVEGGARVRPRQQDAGRERPAQVAAGDRRPRLRAGARSHRRRQRPVIRRTLGRRETSDRAGHRRPGLLVVRTIGTLSTSAEQGKYKDHTLSK